MNNKHTSYVKIPKKINNNEVRPASGGVRYIEKNFNNNKFNSEYINQINSNLNNNNEPPAMRGSYALIDKERNSIKSINNNRVNKPIYNMNDNININNNKNDYGFNGMTTYNYNSFRKNNKFN